MPLSDLLNVCLASDKRRNFLLLLAKGPKNWEEIKTTLDVTSTGMLPQVKILEEEGLIIREGREFRLTPMGRVLVTHFAPFLATVETFEREKKYWQEHLIDVLPEDILFDVRALGNYRLIQNPDEEIFDINTFLKNISTAKTLKGISHTIHPKYPRFFLDMAKRGTKSSLILTPGVFKIVKEKHAGLLSEWLACDNTGMYVSPEDIKFSFTVTDTYFSISLFYNTGIFDSKNDLVSNDASAIRWGERIFAHFLRKCDRVEPDD